LFLSSVMRISLTVLVSLFFTPGASGQNFISPPSYNFYPDSIAIVLKSDPKNADKELNLLIESSFEQQHFKTTIKDSVVVVPYYTLYDDEAMLFVKLEPGWGQKNFNRQVSSRFVKLRPIKKTDMLESAIYRVMENPSEENLVALARGYEDRDCYGNASFIYYKLYQRGYRSYWGDFIKRNLHRSIHLLKSMER
jgi:hypothetical protein